MKALLKEPLIHFLILGLGLFLLFGFINDGNVDESVEIVVTQGQQQVLILGFEKVWQRKPTKEEHDKLIQRYIREEVYYREAITLGLDKEDTIVRRRMQQKIEFLSEDLAVLEEPDDSELQAYLEVHAEDYREASRYSFRQIYMNDSKRGQWTDAKVKALLTDLKAGTLSAEDAGDTLMLKAVFDDETEHEIERVLGKQFMKALRVTEVGSWQGPLTSGFGLHLIKIDERIDGAIPELEAVRAVVFRDWSSVKRKEMNEKFYETLRERYEVTIEGLSGSDGVIPKTITTASEQ